MAPIVASCSSSTPSAERAVTLGHPTACAEDSMRVLAEVQSDLDDSPRDEDVLLAVVVDQLVCQSDRIVVADEDVFVAPEYIVPGAIVEGRRL